MVKRQILSSVHADQNERSYQKQDNVFESSKVYSAKRGKVRYYKSVGLGYAVPKEAINGVYIDKKCPFTGKISIRGRVVRGVVRSTKMNKTIIVRRDYMHFLKKYQRYEKRHKNFAVHVSPAFRLKAGDEVVCGECRPLSKTVRYNVIKSTQRGSEKQGKAFGKF